MTSQMQSQSPFPISAATIIDLPSPTQPRLSPTSKQLIYQIAPLGRATEHVKTSLWLADTTQKNSARQLTSALHHDRNPEWHPDPSTNLVSFLSDRASAGKSVALYCLNTTGGEAYPITPINHSKSIDSYAWSPNGAFIAYVSADEDDNEFKEKEERKDDVKVYGARWEYARLRFVHVVTREVMTAFAAQSHVHSFSWSPDGKRIVFSTTPTPESNSTMGSGNRFHVYDLATKSVTNTIPWEGTLEGRYTGGIIWAKTGIWFAAGVAPEKCNSSYAVYSLSIEEGKCKRKAYGESSCVASLKSYGDVVFIHELAGMGDNIVLKGQKILSLEKEISSWDARYVNGEAVVAFCASDVAQPTEVHVHSSSGTKQLSTHASTVSSQNYAKYHALKTKSFDSTTKLEGYYITPSIHDSSKPLPTLVTIHGGPYWRMARRFDPTVFGWCPLLLSTGKYGILVVNYRGGAGYGESFAAQARGAMGTVEYDDVIALVEEGIKRGFADKSKIIVSGWSQGGFLSFISAVRNELGQSPRRILDWRFVGAICGAGVADWDLMVMTSGPYSFEAELAGGTPWTADKSHVKGRLGSAIWELQKGAKNTPPLLLLHGEADEIVPVLNAIAFHRGCLRHEIPCEMALYPREPHMMAERLHLLDMALRVQRFVDLHIGS